MYPYSTGATLAFAGLLHRQIKRCPITHFGCVACLKIVTARLRRWLDAQQQREALNQYLDDRIKAARVSLTLESLR